MEAIYGGLWEKEKVLVDKRVVRVEYEDEKPVVFCADGEKFKGDIIVGSDGVRSIIRNEMWRLSELRCPGEIPASERTCPYLFPVISESKADNPRSDLRISRSVRPQQSHRRF